MALIFFKDLTVSDCSYLYLRICLYGTEYKFWNNNLPLEILEEWWDILGTYRLGGDVLLYFPGIVGYMGTLPYLASIHIGSLLYQNSHFREP